VTGVIAVSAVIAGFVWLGPSGPLCTGAKGAVPPVTSVLAVLAVTLPGCHARTVGTGPPPPQRLRGGRGPRDLRVDSDRCDPPRSSRHHGGHRHTSGAGIAVTAAGAARRARRARRVCRDQQDPASPLKGGPGLIGRDARNRGFSRRCGLSRRGLRWPRHSTKMSNGREPRCRP
jgi:hypothetical protein